MIGATGSLISKNLILTAGKNIYNKKLGQFAQDIWFIPSLLGDIGKAYRVSKTYYIPKKYISEQHEEVDLFNFAILEIEEELIGLTYGYFGIDVDYKPSMGTFVAGYSSEKSEDLKCFLRTTPLEQLVCQNEFFSYKETMYNT